MKILNQKLLDNYVKEDIILKLLNATAQGNDADFTSHQWLLESLPKRVVYFNLYGDLLQLTNKPQRILDVGGGYCSLSRMMIKNHDYTLQDIMVHDDHELLREMEQSINKIFWGNSNWDKFKVVHDYDLVIANDLFPNVDQRLEMFIDKFISLCYEIRLSLTYYNTPRYYSVKRLDADEIFHIQTWDGVQVRRVLEKYRDRIFKYQPDILLLNPPSLFANNRQVCIVTICGDIEDNKELK